MAVKRPTLSQLNETALSLGIHLSDAQTASYLALLQPNFDAYDVVDGMPDYVPVVTYARTPGFRPDAADNKHGAWYVKTTIQGASTGQLAGKTVVLKDNVCLAGVPMTNGASTLEGYVPNVDATIVTRLLDAGATVYTTLTAWDIQPEVRRLVVLHLAIGGDQGGSIRMPASFCGIYGMKATHGLVPYTGVMPIELTLDHTGPMTANVMDNALMLEVLAGPDGLDPRQHAGETAKPYSELMKGGVEGMKIGIVTEGFGWPQSAVAVDAKVRDAAAIFTKLGADVTEVSIPMHRAGPAIWLPIAAEGATQQMMKDNGHGFNWKGLYATSMIDFHAGWKARADELSETLKITMVLGEYFIKHYRGHFYGKAQNLSRQLTATYDKVFAEYDLLLMPTVPITATPLPPAGASIEEVVSRAFEMLPNTCPFDVTGHPAMSVPCGKVDGLPVGMMLVAKRYDEASIYRAAFAFEQAVNWQEI
eukprot:gene18561-18845_t